MKKLDVSAMEKIQGGGLCNGAASGALAGIGVGLTLTGAGAGVGLFFGALSVGLEYYCDSKSAAA